MWFCNLDADGFYFQYVLKLEFIEIKERRNAVLSNLFLLSFVVYMQVVVWKRLRECNEELIIRTTCITIYLGNLVLSLLCPIEEKIKLYLYVIGGSPMPLRSHVAGEHQIFSK